MNDFKSLVHIREDSVDGISGWMWPRQDEGLWDGPKMNWETKFRDMYIQHRPGKRVVVQAGGGCGMYPRLLSNHFDVVYTFEPYALNFHCLVNNCQKRNIIKYNAALGDAPELVDVSVQSMSNLGMNVVDIDPLGIIPQMRIDDLPLHACDMILLDIEGYEFKALKGALKTIEKFKPLVVLESARNEHLELLQTYGYSVVGHEYADTFYVSKV